jgi:hypothetical protein
MFCFVCYLFKDNIHAGGDTFVIGGFWNFNNRIASLHGVFSPNYFSAYQNKLLKFVLTVAIDSVESIFSVMTSVKSERIFFNDFHVKNKRTRWGTNCKWRMTYVISLFQAMTDHIVVFFPSFLTFWDTIATMANLYFYWHEGMDHF